MSQENEFLEFLLNEQIYQIADSTEETVVDKVKEGNVAYSTGISTLKEPKEEPTVVAGEGILILFDNVLAEGMLDSERDYLSKILGAVGKDINAVIAQNVSKQKPEYQGFSSIVAFTPNHQLPVDLATQQYEMTNLLEARLIVADSLSNIAASPELRKKLWSVLQQMFLK